MNHLRLKLRRDSRGERGMVSFATLIALLFLAVFGALVFNAGQTVTRKIEAQNAADAVAYSSSVWVARGMNAVTAANHMMGELTALYVLHHSLGGRWIDEHGRNKQNGEGLRWTNTKLMLAYYAAKWSPGTVPVPDTPYKKCKQNPCGSVESTVYDAKKELKAWLTFFYGAHAAGGWAQITLYGYWPGLFAQVGAVFGQWKVYQEWIVLDGVEMVAERSAPMAQAIVGVDKNGNHRGGGVLAALNNYVNPLILIGVPVQAQRAALAVAEQHGAEGAVRGDIPGRWSLDSLTDLTPKLPIERHLHQGADRSQLMRATYPWVCRWRRPIRSVFRWTATLSRAEYYYRVHTNQYSQQAVIWLQLKESQRYRGFSDYGMGRQGKNLRLYVIKGLNHTLPRNNGFHKSLEKWNEPGNDRLAERHFSHMGYARIDKAGIGAEAVYRQEAPDGFVCFAQSMIYNANPQQAPAENRGSRQPHVGWDTLNWVSDVPEFSRNNNDDSHNPRIKLNWQARLTPVTPTKLFVTAVTIPGGEMSGPLQRSLPALILNNH